MIVPAEGVDAAISISRPPVRKSARKSHAFKILTFKVFVMNILRGISPVKVAKLLIPDILQNGGGGGGLG